VTPRRSLVGRIVRDERINFILTNRIPRRLATRLMGWFSRIEQPLLCRVALLVWQRFGGNLDLHEAKKTRFVSVHDCFVRELKDGARPIDPRPNVIVSPCDGIVVAAGRIEEAALIQAKGLTYTLDELLVDPALADVHRNAVYVTLRLTSNMYHRFHAPADCEIDEVIHVAGDTWNVNPAALRRIERLYCRNERAIVRARLRASGDRLILVPVGAILVGSIHLHVVDVPLNAEYRGPSRIPCRALLRKGDELGYFHHGSTIIVVAGPGLTIFEEVREGALIRMGRPLLLLNQR
jgi:phosphatidylserine decarboxylase